MAKIVTTRVLDTNASDILETQINQAVQDIQSRGNDIEIQYTQPVKTPGYEQIWSALIIEKEGHPF